MHYIVGTEIYIEPTRNPNNHTLQPINAHRVTMKNKSIGPFEPGVRYSLHHIKKVADGYEYQFSTDIGAPVSATFGCVADAENTIAVAKQESIPDYEGWHSRRRD